MNAQHTTFIKKIGLSLCLFVSASCTAQQPPSSETKSNRPAAIEPAVTKCPAVGEFLSILGQKKIYEQTPELFLPTVAGQLKSTKDEIKPLSPSEQIRTLTLAPTSGDWLLTGEAIYRSIKDGPEFNALSIDINKTCFSAAKELIALGENAVGTGGKKIKLPPPNTTEMIVWRWKDPDINMIRTLELTASHDSYSLSVKRDPDSEGAGG